jgi:hypothetical protein
MDIVLLVVFYRISYKLSLRNLAEMFLIRRIHFFHETVREMKSSHLEHLGRIAQTQFVTNSIENNQKNYICRILKVIESNAATIIEYSLALFTPKYSISESSNVCSLIFAGGRTMGAVHLWATLFLLPRGEYQRSPPVSYGLIPDIPVSTIPANYAPP